MRNKFFGDRAFYRKLIVLMLPIMVQNGITNFVNMLDNIMIGAVGTAPMTGVAIANQLLFVFNLCIFGAVSGAGIFGAQFFGSGDHEGVRYTFRFKLIFSMLLSLGCIALLLFAGEDLLLLYMQGDVDPAEMAETLAYGKSYLLIMLIGLLPYALAQCYSGTLRESANPVLPMLAGVIAVVVNLIGNYILIFGKFGAPALGVNGAAIATVISRFAELAIVMFKTHTQKERYSFMRGVYRSLYLPRSLASKLFFKSIPLMLNETIWACGIAMLAQCYSLRGLEAVTAHSISSTFWQVFAVAHMAVGAAVGIILGQLLGAGKLEEARESSYRMLTFSFLLACAVSMVYAVAALFIPYAYNTEPEIQALATTIMHLTCLSMPFDAMTNASYFVLRSGGKMIITFIFDSGFMWFGNVAVAFVLSRFTALTFPQIFAAIQLMCVFKSFLGVTLVHKGGWVRNIIAK